MLIQVVGLPCSGKSTTLRELQKKHSFDHIDKQDHATEASLRASVSKSAKPHCIVESACGYESLESIVILLKVSKKILSKNKKTRNYEGNSKDESQIAYQTIPAHFTVYSNRELKKILTILLGT